MQNAGAMAVLEFISQENSLVQEGVGAETTALGGGVGKGGDLKGI